MGDLDCGDFGTQAAAQYHLNAHPGDPDGLDGDSDGRACESRPCPCYFGQGTAPQPAYALPSPKPAPSAAPPGKASSYFARIVRVIDGDTVRVRLSSGKQRAVRVMGIDTPERGACGARQATAHLTRLAPRRRSVRLRTDPTQARVDRFGRLLAYVSVRGTDVGLSLLRAGWANVFVYAGKPFQRHAVYLRAAAQAKSARRGIHSRCR